MLIPREFLQRLRDSIAVSELINKRVPLKRKGREWEACCPFHQEKTPSFTVNDAKGFYHCFGCGAHGDVIRFMMEYERLPYVEAVEALAREAGLAMPKPSAEAVKREKQRRSLEDVTELAADWFAQQLQLADGHAARDYLAGRGVDIATQRQFRLGWAPDSRSALKEALLQHGVSEQQLVETGLIIKPDDGPAYDRFRGRVIFPILSAQGQVIAFGGRLLQKDAKAAKYLNSPETELFHKGQVLYNWQQARAAVDDKNPLIVAEGYMDVIALHRYGFTQAVAPLGTAMTEHHLRKLWQASDAPILCLDGDAAGQRAMWRAAELALPLLEPGKTLKFCTLPAGEDPDDFLRRHGTAAMRQLLETAQPLSQVMVQHLRQEVGEQTPEQRAALENRLEQLARRIAHPSLQQHFRRYFREQLWPGKRKQKQAASEVVKQRAAAGDPLLEGRISAERLLFKLLLNHPSLWENPAVEEALAAIDCRDALSRTVQRWLLEHGSAFPICEWSAEAEQLKSDKMHPFAAKEAQPEHAWLMALDALHLVQMEEDLRRLRQEEWSEIRQTRENALRQEIASLQAKRFA